MGKNRGEKMKPGEIYTWLDQGPVVLLEEEEILDPVPEDRYEEFLSNPEVWPREIGWTVRLVETDEILQVHAETLSPFALQAH
jgi:hypothetical protein